MRLFARGILLPCITSLSLDAPWHGCMDTTWYACMGASALESTMPGKNAIKHKVPPVQYSAKVSLLVICFTCRWEQVAFRRASVFKPTREHLDASHECLANALVCRPHNPQLPLSTHSHLRWWQAGFHDVLEELHNIGRSAATYDKAQPDGGVGNSTGWGNGNDWSCLLELLDGDAGWGEA